MIICFDKYTSANFLPLSALWKLLCKILIPDLISEKILMDCQMWKTSFLPLFWLADRFCLVVSPPPPSSAPGLVQQYHTNFVNWNGMLLSSEELLKSAVLINTAGIEPKGIQLKKNTWCYFISHLCQSFDMTRSIRNRNRGGVATDNIFRCKSYYGFFNT